MRSNNRDRVLAFLAQHKTNWYTVKQIAHYLRLSERTALRHLEALLAADTISERKS